MTDSTHPTNDANRNDAVRIGSPPLSSPSLMTGSSSRPVPLVTSLRVLAEESLSPRLRRAIKEVIAALEVGQPAEQVLGNLPQAFPRHISILVDAGIQSGQLPILADEALDYLLRQSQFRRRALWSLSYVALLSAVAGLILFGIMAFLVPQYRAIHQDFGTQLPAVTRALIFVSDGVNGVLTWVTAATHALGWLGSLLGVVVAVGGLVGLGQWVRPRPFARRIRRSYQRALSWMPLLGTLFRALSLSRFFHLLAALVAADIPLPKALRLAATVNDDLALSTGVERTALEIEHGKSALDAARASEAFPRESLPLFCSADNRALFVEALQGASQLYDARSQMQFAVMLVILEPLIIFGVGLTVGLTVIALFMPMVTLLNALG